MIFILKIIKGHNSAKKSRVIILCTLFNDALYICSNFMKISLTVLKLRSRHNFYSKYKAA